MSERENARNLRKIQRLQAKAALLGAKLHPSHNPAKESFWGWTALDGTEMGGYWWDKIEEAYDELVRYKLTQAGN